MNHRRYLLVALALLAVLLLAACAPQTVEVTRVVTETETVTETVTEQVEVTRVVEGEVVTEVQEVEVEVTRVVEVAGAAAAEGDMVSEFHTAWPYQAPPAGHFNTFVSDAINLSIYQQSHDTLGKTVDFKFSFTR